MRGYLIAQGLKRKGAKDAEERKVFHGIYADAHKDYAEVIEVKTHNILQRSSAVPRASLRLFSLQEGMIELDTPINELSRQIVTVLRLRCIVCSGRVSSSPSNEEAMAIELTLRGHPLYAPGVLFLSFTRAILLGQGRLVTCW